MTVSNLSLFYPSIPDENLNFFWNQAEEDFKDYCNIDTVPANCDMLLTAMAKELINKAGAEGFDSESAGGASLSYVDGYSAHIMKRLAAHKRIRTV